MLYRAIFNCALFAIAAFGCGNSKSEETSNCRPPKGCPQQYICAQNGCIPLISGEPETMWKTELAAQTGENGSAWSPRPAFGEKLLETTLCSGIEKDALDKQKGGVLTPKRGITIYAFSAQDVKILQQKKSSSSMWQDHIKFRFPRKSVTGTPTYCISQNLDSIKVLPSKVETAVEALLVEAAPANAPFTVAMMERRPLGAQASQPLTYEIILAPVRTQDRKETSVLILPLGTDVLSMKGPSPTKQRLLRGFVAYYFTHTENREQITVNMQLPPSSPSLNWSQVKP